MGYNVKTVKQRTAGKRNDFRTFEDLEVYQGAREFRKKDVRSHARATRFREI